MATITVRIVQRKGKLRVLNVHDGRFVSCSRDWRQTAIVGASVNINATLRIDSACWIADKIKGDPIEKRN